MELVIGSHGPLTIGKTYHRHPVTDAAVQVHEVAFQVLREATADDWRAQCDAHGATGRRIPAGSLFYWVAMD